MRNNALALFSLIVSTLAFCLHVILHISQYHFNSQIFKQIAVISAHIRVDNDLREVGETTPLDHGGSNGAKLVPGKWLWLPKSPSFLSISTWEAMRPRPSNPVVCVKLYTFMSLYHCRRLRILATILLVSCMGSTFPIQGLGRN